MKATEQEIKDDLLRTRLIHGDMYEYKLKKGTRIDLGKLKDNQRVCASQIKGYHTLLTLRTV